MTNLSEAQELTGGRIAIDDDRRLHRHHVKRIAPVRSWRARQEPVATIARNADKTTNVPSELSRIK